MAVPYKHDAPASVSRCVANTHIRRSEEEMLKVRNFGKTSLVEIKEKLGELGLKLGMQAVPSSDNGKVG